MLRVLVAAALLSLLGCGSPEPAPEGDVCLQCRAAGRTKCRTCRPGADHCCCVTPNHACTCPPDPTDPDGGLR